MERTEPSRGVFLFSFFLSECTDRSAVQCSALPWGLMVEGIKEQGTKRKRNKGHLLFTSTRVGQKRRRAAVAACGTNYANRMQKLNNLLKTTQKMFFVFCFFI